MLLLAETNAITEKKCYKKYAVRFFCSSSSKRIFILVAEFIASYVVITSINVRKPYFDRMLTRAFM